MVDSEKGAILRIGSKAPNFSAKTTHGDIEFYDFIGDNWVLFFSHPEDFTPVCTTEMGALSSMQDMFTERNVKLIGLSVNTVQSHMNWKQDIEDIYKTTLDFPIIDDQNRQLALLFQMIDQEDTTNLDSQGMALTIRSVYIIDPTKTIRTILSYPASTGRNTTEILRIIDSLQTVDKHGVKTPANWTKGDDVIISPGDKRFDGCKGITTVKPYLRYVEEPAEPAQ